MIDKDIERILYEEGKSDDYILGYLKGYAQGEYDTKQELKSELEKYKKAYELETYERQKFIEELETWKKIAEKLAEYIAEKSNFCANKCCMNEDCHDNDCIIDWARKEVDKDVNN